MKGRWMLVLAAMCAAPTAGAAQQYTLRTSAGITSENFRSFITGSLDGFGSSFVDGVMVERGGFGETFTIDVGSTLFSWRLDHERCQMSFGQSSPIDGGQCVFRAYLAGFDAASGGITDVLWESAAYTPVLHSYPWPFTPGIWLDPGKYVGFVLWEGTPPEPGFTGSATQSYSQHYPIGGQAPASPGMELVKLASRDPGLHPGETVWNVYPTRDTQGFSATLDSTVTPEPATLALLGTGLAGLAGAARRRRRREAAPE